MGGSFISRKKVRGLGLETTAPRKVSRRLLENKPYIVWNEFVNILAMSEYPRLSKKQRPAHLVFWYYSEVENGGHMQYFENRGTARVTETVAALELLGCSCHAKVLSRAAAQLKSKPRSRIRLVEEYSETALQGEFDRFDNEYAKCQPTLDKAVEGYLARNQSEFVLVGETTDPEVLERDAKLESVGRQVMKHMKAKFGRDYRF